jgi:hypothetical protein
MARRAISAEQIDKAEHQREAEAREREARDAREREERAPLRETIVLRVSSTLAMWLTKHSRKRLMTPSAFARRILREVMLADREK